MNNKFFKVVLGIALAATSIKANAQTTYERGLYMTSTKVNNEPVTEWNYFTPDSLSIRYFAGRGAFKVITNATSSFCAILVDISSATIKKVAILNMAELKEMFSEYPRFTYTPTNETRMISNFNCKKIIATNLINKKTYEVWTTKDVVLPGSAIPIYYQGIDGFPMRYVSFKDGVENLVTVLTIRTPSFPAYTFNIPPDFFKISYNDYKVLIGRY